MPGVRFRAGPGHRQYYSGTDRALSDAATELEQSGRYMGNATRVESFVCVYTYLIDDCARSHLFQGFSFLSDLLVGRKIEWMAA